VAYTNPAGRNDVFVLRGAPASFARARELFALSCTPRMTLQDTLAYLIDRGHRTLHALPGIDTIHAARLLALKRGAVEEQELLDTGRYRIAGDATDFLVRLSGRVSPEDRAVLGDLARTLGLDMDTVGLMAIALILIDCPGPTDADHARLVAIVKSFLGWLKGRVAKATAIQQRLSQAPAPRRGRPRPSLQDLLRGI
jgi:hypothetical protein